MKKVATITLQYPYNYGSSLQAYALQTYLTKQNLEVTIINYLQHYDYQNYKIFRTSLYLHRPQAFIADLLYLSRNLKRRRNFQRFFTQHLNLSKKTYTDPGQLAELGDTFDGYICGSDQIWNFDCTDGADPAYFLTFADSSKVKASYAPSLAQMNFKKDDREAVKKYLSDFDAISIREKSTLSEFKRRFNVSDATITVDPTLLLSSDDYSEIISKRTVSLPSKDYIFVYMLEENFDLLNFSRKLAQSENLEIVYISNISKKGQLQMRGFRNAFGISPADFLYYLKNARYVVTNSFHATVFSILFSRQFATFMTRRSSSRMRDLLTALDLESRCPENQDFNIQAPIDYSKVQQRVLSICKPSLEYLQRVIKML